MTLCWEGYIVFIFPWKTEVFRGVNIVAKINSLWEVLSELLLLTAKKGSVYHPNVLTVGR